MDDLLAILFVLAIIALSACIYCLPAIIAFRRNHPNRWLILAINLCLGSTVIIWFVCLIWACHKVHDPGDQERLSAGGESGLNLFVNDAQTIHVVHEEAQPMARPIDFVDQLERLAALKERGLLTDEDYHLQKQRILAEQTTP